MSNQNETVLITGCSSGIGRATAELTARRGHRVIATAPDESELAKVPDSVALRLPLDVTVAGSEVRSTARPSLRCLRRNLLAGVVVRSVS